jgi:hypothetical protein
MLNTSKVTRQSYNSVSSEILTIFANVRSQLSRSNYPTLKYCNHSSSKTGVHRLCVRPSVICDRGILRLPNSVYNNNCCNYTNRQEPGHNCAYSQVSLYDFNLLTHCSSVRLYFDVGITATQHELGNKKTDIKRICRNLFLFC